MTVTGIRVLSWLGSVLAIVLRSSGVGLAELRDRGLAAGGNPNASSVALPFLFLVALLPFLPLVALPMVAGAQQDASMASLELEEAGHEDYRHAIGHMDDGVLKAEMVARRVAWRPWGADGPALDAHAFAEEGAAARVPGPMLRVTAGTPIHLSLRNELADTLLVRGLRDRGQQLPPGMPPGPALVSLAFLGDSVVLAPGATVQVQFTPTVPGSYFYFGKTVEAGWSDTPQPLFGADAEDRALVGVLLVDAPDELPDPHERVFLITHWADREDEETWLPTARFMINGRSWPHTERLVYAQGDTVRWRVINQSGAFHPMHLHGFYFQVHEWTAQTGLALDLPIQQPMAVTWPLPVSAAMRVSWVAEEPGNWLFHCHLMRHMSWAQAPPTGEGPPAHAHEAAEGVDLLGGMVLGITVEPAHGYRPPDEVPRHRLRLHMGMRPGVFDGEPAYGFVLQEGPEPPAPDSVRFPGSPIVLTRGEPSEILVFNHADVPMGVHWHGLELESWADGVPGWSGMPGSPVPAILPGDSLAVRITPPRAGTFMYHVHSEPGHQLALGLYGSFVVLEPDEALDPETDRLFLLGALGAGEDPPPVVNGVLEPEAMEFRVGRPHRLRFMHISPDGNKMVRLLRGEEPVNWQVVARDGWNVPPHEVPTVPADFPFMDVGTTIDALWTPEEPGNYILRIITVFDQGLAAFPRDAPPPHTLDIPLRVMP
jgi:manganese oxidase